MAARTLATCLRSLPRAKAHFLCSADGANIVRSLLTEEVSGCGRDCQMLAHEKIPRMLRDLSPALPSARTRSPIATCGWAETSLRLTLRGFMPHRRLPGRRTLSWRTFASITASGSSSQMLRGSERHRPRALLSRRQPSARLRSRWVHGYSGSLPSARCQGCRRLSSGRRKAGRRRSGGSKMSLQRQRGDAMRLPLPTMTPALQSWHRRPAPWLQLSR